MKFFYIVLACVAVGLAGCAKPSLEQQLIGTWNGSKTKSVSNMTDPAQDQQFKNSASGTVIELMKDKTFRISAGTTVTGTWEVSGNTVLLYSKAGPRSGSQKPLSLGIVDSSTLTFQPPRTQGKVILERID